MILNWQHVVNEIRESNCGPVGGVDPEDVEESIIGCPCATCAQARKVISSDPGLVDQLLSGEG